MAFIVSSFNITVISPGIINNTKPYGTISNLQININIGLFILMFYYHYAHFLISKLNESLPLLQSRRVLKSPYWDVVGVVCLFIIIRLLSCIEREINYKVIKFNWVINLCRKLSYFTFNRRSRFKHIVNIQFIAISPRLAHLVLIKYVYY